MKMSCFGFKVKKTTMKTGSRAAKRNTQRGSLHYAELIAASEIMLGKMRVSDTGFNCMKLSHFTAAGTFRVPKRLEILELRNEHVQICGRMENAMKQNEIRNNKEAFELLLYREKAHAKAAWELDRLINNQN
jgi:hypothetical protein